jgi:spermidine synthase/tetratricopeptide (TPR) repeat protein
MSAGDVKPTGCPSRKSAARRVSLLYCLSGFVSLAYQVTWFRIFVDQFGSTNLTFILVLTNFIGGLGVGALASNPLTRWIAGTFKLEDRFRVYGAVELLVSATVLLTVLVGPLTTDSWGPFPYLLRDGVYVQTLPYQLAKVGLATLCVFLPCFFMGVTFPLLCNVFREDERFPSSLYAWNTLGACSGVLVCQFLVILWIGHSWAFWAAAGLNTILGAYFLATGGAPEARRQPPPSAPESAMTPAVGTGNLGLLLTCAVLSGLLAGAIEGEMFRRIKFLGYYASSAMSFASFWAILGIFLASLTVRMTPALHLLHIKIAFVLALACYTVVGFFAYPIHFWIVSLVTSPDANTYLALFFPMRPVQVLLFSGILIFPAYFLISLLLPYLCNRIQARRGHLGVAYGLNTVAFCLGIVSFTWIAPRVSIFYSIKLMTVVFAIGTAFLLTLSETRRLAVWKPLVALASLVVACVLTPSDFDPSLLAPKSPPTLHPMRAMRSDGSQTTYVISAPEGDLLYYDNMSLSNTRLSAQVYMRLMAHFPLLAHPNPKDALLICYGVGNTASAIASHDTIERIDVVELNRNVVATAPEFGSVTSSVHEDPRVRFIHDDGRNFLRLTDRTYDLITSEPPPPLHEGVYRLYSLEYYTNALEHLTPDGMMTQWLPVWQMPAEAANRIISTFLTAFPNAIMFAGSRNNLILVGSHSPIDLGRLERRFLESPRVRNDLERLGVRTPTAFLARILKGNASLRREYSGQRVIRDARNDLAHLYLDPRQHAWVSYNPVEVLAELRNSELASIREVEAILMHLGRLTYHAPVFPTKVLANVASQGVHGVTLAEVDWQRIEMLQRRYDRSKRSRPGQQALSPLQTALELTGGQLPAALLEVGREQFRRGQTESAVRLLHRFVALEPREAVGYYLLGMALANLGEYGAAMESLERSVELAPEKGNTHWALGVVLSSQGELERAETQLRTALRHSPGFKEGGPRWREKVKRELRAIQASIAERK